MFCWNLRRELASDAHVNSVCPGVRVFSSEPSLFPSARSSCHTGYSWMQQSSPVALLLKPQSCWHDKCGGQITVKQMMTPTTPWWWLGFNGAHVGLTDWNGRGGVRMSRERGLLRRADSSENIWRWENLLPLVKAFPKKELSLFTLLPSDLTPAPGLMALRAV